MKKITFLCMFLISTLGFSQVVLEDFEAYPAGDLEAFEGATSATVVADPAPGGTNGNVLEIVSSASGNPWQGASMLLQSNYVDLTTDKSIQMDIYSADSFGMLVAVENPSGSSPRSAGDDDTNLNYVGGSGWQTITITLNQNLDGTVTANGEYELLAFFPGWVNSSNSWATGAPGVGSANTIYIDNIRGVEGTAIPASCNNDGVQNNGETGIDCGTPECGPCAPIPAEAAPTPTTPDGEVISIYSDTGGANRNFSNEIVFDYSFGATAGPDVDLDPTAGENFALQMDFSAQGYGQGKNPGTSVDLSTYNFINFDYWADTNSTEIQFILINEGMPEYVYELSSTGPGGAPVQESWTTVSIPLASFTGFNKAQFFQYKLGTSSDLVSEYVYFDNIYFSSNQVLNTENFDKAEFKVFPNPSNGNWNISSNSTISTVKVYDILGKQVSSMTPNSNEVNIDASNYKSGIYFAKIEGETGSKTVKLIRQ